MEKKGSNPVLHEQFHQIVEQQIRENYPRETKETLDRLINWDIVDMKRIHKIRSGCCRRTIGV